MNCLFHLTERAITLYGCFYIIPKIWDAIHRSTTPFAVIAVFVDLARISGEDAEFYPAELRPRSDSLLTRTQAIVAPSKFYHFSGTCNRSTKETS